MSQRIEYSADHRGGKDKSTGGHHMSGTSES